jgi:hypothetical protein
MAKSRNYSFRQSKKLPEERMTEINDLKIPARPGTCFHAIMCSLAITQDQFCPWDRLYGLTARFMRQYGGRPAWSKFTARQSAETWQKRIRDNTHMLTRAGRNCYGLRLHERGCTIYIFRDGAVLLTGGEFTRSGRSYKLIFSDGRGLQVRHRGNSFTSREYDRFVEKGLIGPSCEIIDSDGIRQTRAEISQLHQIAAIKRKQLSDAPKRICLKIDGEYDQEIADRLEANGLTVEAVVNNEVIGMAKPSCFTSLENDDSVKSFNQK